MADGSEWALNHQPKFSGMPKGVVQRWTDERVARQKVDRIRGRRCILTLTHRLEPIMWSNQSSQTYWTPEEVVVFVREDSEPEEMEPPNPKLRLVTVDGKLI